MVRLNRTRTNHGIPWERVAPAAQNTLTSGWILLLAPRLLRNLFVAPCVWAQLGLRAPRGQKLSSERGVRDPFAHHRVAPHRTARAHRGASPRKARGHHHHPSHELVGIDVHAHKHFLRKGEFFQHGPHMGREAQNRFRAKHQVEPKLTV